MKFISRTFDLCARAFNSLFVRSKVLPKTPADEFQLDASIPTFYIGRLNSRTDVAALAAVCRKLGLPDPHKDEHIDAKVLPRFIGIQNPPPLFGSKSKPSNALTLGKEIFTALENSTTKTVQVIPVTILWGRNPGKEKPGLSTLISHSLTPSWFRKIFVVLFSGRDNLIRFSQPLDLNELMHEKGDKDELPHKLIRVARVHFHRQKLAATGPKLPSREKLFNSLLASPTIKKAIADEAKSKGLSHDEARQNALRLLDEIAANYSDATIRVGDRILTWLWNKLYNGIDVNYAEQVRDLTDKGHEIIYVPCHRSHMDYLLLTYVIYHQGLVPPHIAAGINLDFFPAGPIFRRSGAFFIRRSFSGNKLYSAVFKEYLSQLFIKGYSVKYYTEGGRSRTGRLLAPKTGMLAMTLQAMLRGIDRPISIVPVYIGYEHVMEINTYLKELAGNSKKNESVLGVFKAIKNLKNYGRGNVNFGDPINVNQFLNEHQSDWRDAIHPTDVQKPAWLGSQVQNLADSIMTNINNAAAINSVNLLATILLANDQYALSKPKLIAQMQLYLTLLDDASYSEKATLPEMDAKQLLEHALTLNKFDVIQDSLGDIISISEKERTLFNYYRNNIVHLFALPSVIAGQLVHRQSLSVEQCKAQIQRLYPVFAAEWFLHEYEDAYVDRILASMENQGLLTREGDMLHVSKHDDNLAKLDMLAKVVHLTLERYALVTGLMTHEQGITGKELEQESTIIANRLGTLHGIKSPEFYDKKVLTGLISTLKEQQLVHDDEQGKMMPSASLNALYADLQQLLPARVWQSISDTVAAAKTVS